MLTFYATENKQINCKVGHDSTDKKYYKIAWGLSARANSTEYFFGTQVIQGTPNGLKYVCINPGISASSEPTMGVILDSETTDGSVIWKSKKYDLVLLTGDTFTSTWTASDASVATDNEGTDTENAWIRVTAVPNSDTFTLTKHITGTRADSKVEEYDQSIVVPIRER